MQNKPRKEARCRPQPTMAKIEVVSANRSRRENEPQMLCAQPYRVIKERRSLVRRGDLEIAVPCLHCKPRLGTRSQPIPEIFQVFFDFRFDSVEVCAGELPTFRPAARKKVIFYFWLCA